MLDSLETYGIEALSWTKESLKAFVALLEKETPEIVLQLINWYTLHYALLLMLGVAFLVFSIWYIRYLIANDERLEETYGDFIIFSWLLSIVSLITGVILIICNLADLLKILVAPKIWLIEYINELIKSGG